MDILRTIDDVGNLLNNIKQFDVWSIHLLKITQSSRNGATYLTKQIALSPTGKLKEIIKCISDSYLLKGYLENRYETLEEYDGVNIGKIIYRMPGSSELIIDKYQAFMSAINNSNIDDDIKSVKFSGYVLCGDLNGESIKLISLLNPISSYENKLRFLWDKSTFKEIKSEVLQIKEYVDVIIYKGYVYFMNINAERLFDMERTYRKKCEKDVECILEKNIVSNADLFEEIATSGHNPRKFLSFNKKNLDSLTKSKEKRKEIAKIFKIKITKEGQLDTSTKKSCDDIVKILCNKAMLEPFDNQPMEVEGAKRWD